MWPLQEVCRKGLQEWFAGKVCRKQVEDGESGVCLRKTCIPVSVHVSFHSSCDCKCMLRQWLSRDSSAHSNLYLRVAVLLGEKAHCCMHSCSSTPQLQVPSKRRIALQ
jgi:hypothetical protein